MAFNAFQLAFTMGPLTMFVGVTALAGAATAMPAAARPRRLTPARAARPALFLTEFFKGVTFCRVARNGQ